MRYGAGIYCLTVGVFMVAWWTMDVARGVLSRPDRTRPEITLHVAAELVTAALLIAGGTTLVAGGTTELALVGLGMLLYTVIASPGYFVARKQMPPVFMFAVLTVLTFAAIAFVFAA